MTLTSGIWFNTGSGDPWKFPAPEAWAWGGTDDATRYDMLDRNVEWRPYYETPLLISENVPELSYFWYEGVSGLAKGSRREFQDSSAIVYGFPDFPFSYDDNTQHWNGEYPHHRTYYMETFGLEPGGQKAITSPLCHFGFQILNYWRKEEGKLSRVPDYREYVINGRTPLFWQGLDLSEYIYNWTTYYNNTGETSTDARDLLDYYSFVQFSEDNDASTLDRVKFDVWREHGEKVQDGIVELIEESGAWASFVSNGVDSACEYKFTIKHRHFPRPLTETLDFDEVKNKNLISFPTMRLVDDYATNLIETVWGSFAVNDLPTTDEGDAITPTRLQSGDRLENDYNVIKDQIDQSVKDVGELDTEISCRHVQDPVMASARMRKTLPRFANRLRELQFEMGPLHYKWKVGDVVPVKCTRYGLDNVPFVITKKNVTVWPFPQASVEMLEYSEDPIKMPPNDESLRNNLLGYWVADSGLTFAAGSSTEVREWEEVDSKNDTRTKWVSNVYMTNLTYEENYWNGRDFLSCDGTDMAFQLADKERFNTKDLEDFGTWPHSDFTFISVIQPNVRSDIQMLLHMKSYTGNAWTQRELGFGLGVNDYYLFDGELSYFSKSPFDTTKPHIATTVLRRGAGENSAYNRVEMYKNLEDLGVNRETYTQYRVDAGDYPGASIIYSGADLSHPTFGMRTPDYGGSPDSDIWPYDGRIGAMVFYDRALLPHELEKVVRYLADYYGIEV